MNGMVPTKPLLATCVAALALAAAAMPTRNELKKVQSLVNELMADDISAMKSGKLKASQVAVNAEKLAGDAQGEAAKFLLYKGAFGLYVQGGSYDEAIRAIEHLTDAVKNVPDNVLAEILREKLKRIPKKNGSAIFNLYDGICRRMNAAKEREKLEKQVKASPTDKSARRQLATRCAQMGDWKAAREHFAALGGDEAAAVKAEGSDPAIAADFWWGFKPDDGVDDDTFREHAAVLYRKAIDGGGLAGLKLVLAKKRVAEFAPAAEQGAAPQKSEPAAEAPKREVAAQPAREETKQTARATGGKRIDWSLPKNFKGKRFVDLDLGGGETMTFVAIPAGNSCFKNDHGQGLGAHNMKITYPFWTSQIPVTSRQFRMAGIDIPAGQMGGDFFEEKFANDKDSFVLACVQPGKIAAYFDWLNAQFGSRLPKGFVFRPPTQGEYLRLNDIGGIWPLEHGKPTAWLTAVHSKGLLTDCQSMQDVKQLGMRSRFFRPAALFVDGRKFLSSRSIFAARGDQFCLDRISMPENLKGKIYSQELTPFLEKATGYQSLETNPFRYVSDEMPDIWVTVGGRWYPADTTISVLIRVAVGPDYVGEWKAKNGK